MKVALGMHVLKISHLKKVCDIFMEKDMFCYFVPETQPTSAFQVTFQVAVRVWVVLARKKTSIKSQFFYTYIYRGGVFN